MNVELQSNELIFFTFFSILGVDHFDSLTIQSCDLELISERELAEKSKSSRSIETKRSKTVMSNTQILQEPLGIKWSEIIIHNFTRTEQNTVYKQFFRMMYTVEIRDHKTEIVYTLKVR